MEFQVKRYLRCSRWVGIVVVIVAASAAGVGNDYGGTLRTSIGDPTVYRALESGAGVYRVEVVAKNPTSPVGAHPESGVVELRVKETLFGQAETTLAVRFVHTAPGRKDSLRWLWAPFGVGDRVVVGIPVGREVVVGGADPAAVPEPFLVGPNEEGTIATVRAIIALHQTQDQAAFRQLAQTAAGSSDGELIRYVCEAVEQRLFPRNPEAAIRVLTTQPASRGVSGLLASKLGEWAAYSREPATQAGAIRALLELAIMDADRRASAAIQELAAIARSARIAAKQVLDREERAAYVGKIRGAQYEVSDSAAVESVVAWLSAAD